MSTAAENTAGYDTAAAARARLSARAPDTGVTIMSEKESEPTYNRV
ncbi:hypothetical protein ABZ424_23990 [Streptomyces sp. NPDC005790]